MTVAHAIYIPLTALVGAYLGFWLGQRSVQRAWDAAERRRAREESETGVA